MSRVKRYRGTGGDSNLLRPGRFTIWTLQHFRSVVSCVVPVGNVSRMLFQEERSSKLRLRRGVVQAAHTHNNSHVKWTGVYCAWVVNNAVTSELYWVQFSRSWVPSWTLTLIVHPASFEAAGHRSGYFCRLQLEHKAATLALVTPHIARAINIYLEHIWAKRNGRKLSSSHAWSAY
jgi:hypothetical protein